MTSYFIFLFEANKPFIKTAENPAFWTDPSVTNFILILFVSDLTCSGILYPQNTPMSVELSECPSLMSK